MHARPAVRLSYLNPPSIEFDDCQLGWLGGRFGSQTVRNSAGCLFPQFGQFLPDFVSHAFDGLCRDAIVPHFFKD